MLSEFLVHENTLYLIKYIAVVRKMEAIFSGPNV